MEYKIYKIKYFILHYFKRSDLKFPLNYLHLYIPHFTQRHSLRLPL